MDKRYNLLFIRLTARMYTLGVAGRLGTRQEIFDMLKNLQRVQILLLACFCPLPTIFLPLTAAFSPHQVRFQHATAAHVRSVADRKWFKSGQKAGKSG